MNNRRNTQYWQHLQLIGFNVKADFVTYVHTHITFHIIRRVGKVEHLLRTDTLENQSLLKGRITLETSKTFLPHFFHNKRCQWAPGREQTFHPSALVLLRQPAEQWRLLSSVLASPLQKTKQKHSESETTF